MRCLSGEVVDAISKQSETRSQYTPSLPPAEGASVPADNVAIAGPPHQSTSTISSELNANMNYEFMYFFACCVK